MSNVYPLTQNVPDIVVTMHGDADPTVDGEDGTTTVSVDGGDVVVTIGPPEQPKKETEDFDDNIAELLNEHELSSIAEKLLMGIEQDDQSRSLWQENLSQGISLLGLQIKNPRGASASGATPAEGTSTVDHPLMLEATLNFQANAQGELLPSDGPIKVRNDGDGTALTDELATHLEKDLNHYLTKVATEYYDDTDRMLLLVGFSGIGFKKGYHDPIKRRPVIHSINAEDLIVSNAATNLDNAGRVTHRIMIRPSQLRRMQLVGAYRDIPLQAIGMVPQKDPVKAKIDQVQGVAPSTVVEPEDQDRELYECYCEIEVPGFEHTISGAQTGLPLPYKVTIDKEARRILEIRRNWHEDDPFCLPRNRIIAYTFVPGLGFYGIGLLNILGNATKAVTAAWRLMLDAGMFANFPGFLYLKSLAKQLTNQFRVPPGGGMPIDASGGTKIGDMVMPLPYKDPSAVFIQLIENISTAAQRVGGTAALQVGEGKQDAPVGTTLALIEQATKTMSAVHKRLHRAQGAEFDMLKSLLMEDPEALWRHNKKSAVLKYLVAQYGATGMTDEEDAAEQHHRQLFLAALDDCELIPRADPNTSSQTERYLKASAMRQMATSNQGLDLNEVDKRCFKIMGIDDGDSLFKPPPPPGAQQPAPENITAQATMIAAQARMAEANTSAQVAQQKAQLSVQEQQTDVATKQSELDMKERIANLGVARELVIHNADQAQAQKEMDQENQQRSADRVHKLAMASLANRHSAAQGVADRTHDLITGRLDRQHEGVQNAMDRHLQLATQPPPQQAGVAP